MAESRVAHEPPAISPSFNPDDDSATERSLIGAVLLDNTKINALREALPYFREGNCKYIAEAAVHIHEAGKPIDTVTIHHELRTSGKLDVAGGLEYLNTVFDNHGLHGANAQEYANSIRTDQGRIEIKKLAESVSHGRIKDDNISGRLAEIKDLFRAKGTAEELHTISIVEVWTQPAPSTPWRFPGYLAAGDRVVVGGRAKVGKSTMTCDLGLAVATGGDWLGISPVGGPGKVVMVETDHDRPRHGPGGSRDGFREPAVPTPELPEPRQPAAARDAQACRGRTRARVPSGR